uniref:G protein-coupled receptor n=1 Tax=Panagrellus redivivus TaxID=6233 RepID=A0A7E4V025_PANRE
MPNRIYVFILIEYIIALLSECFTLSIFGALLFATIRSKSARYSTSMQIYAIVQTALSISVILYFVYLTTVWQSTEADAYFIYFTGSVQTTLFIMSSLSVCILGIDRCLAVKIPTRSFNTSCFWGYIVVNIVFLAVNLVERLFPAYPATPITHCQYFGCLLSDYQNTIYYILRACGSLINFVVGTVLAVFLKRVTITNRNMVKSSKMVIATCFITVTFDLLPHILSVIAYQIFNFNLASYIGPYSTVIGAIENGICAFFYRTTFKCCNKTVDSSTSNLPNVHNTPNINNETTVR